MVQTLAEREAQDTGEPSQRMMVMFGSCERVSSNYLVIK